MHTNVPLAYLYDQSFPLQSVSTARADELPPGTYIGLPGGLIRLTTVDLTENNTDSLPQRRNAFRVRSREGDLSRKQKRTDRLTSGTAQNAHAGSAGADSTRYSTRDGLHVAEKGRWSLSHMWHRWPHTWDGLPAHADFLHSVHHMRSHLPAYAQLGTQDNGWGCWSGHGLHKILAHQW